MTDSSIAVTSGSGNNVDTRTVSGGDHRQVVVLGDGTNTDVSLIRSLDPGSADAGLVVRDINTSAIVAKLAGTIGIYLASTAGTLGVRVGQIDNLLTLDDNSTGVAPSATVNKLGTVGHNYIMFNANGTWERHRQVETATNSVGTGIAAAGLVAQFDDSGPTSITENQFGNVRMSANRNVYSTLRDAAGNERGLNVDASGNISVTGITNSIAIHILSTNGTMTVKMAADNAGVATDDAAFTAATGSGHPMMAFFDDTATDSVDENDVGVVRMTGNRILMSHTDSTASIFTVSGTTSGGTTSGVTLVAPSASYSFKVYAYSLQTTGIVSDAWRFTNGGGSATEFWRPLVTAASTTSSPVGANMSVTPPSYIFATGTSTTLALKADSGSLVHYSVSYFKESA